MRSNMHYKHINFTKFSIPFDHSSHYHHCIAGQGVCLSLDQYRDLRPLYSSSALELSPQRPHFHSPHLQLQMRPHPHPGIKQEFKTF